MLEFRSLSSRFNDAGPPVDNVSITAIDAKVVPVPGAAALLLGGVALLGAVLRGRRG
ncbi:MAG: hypothetical protein ACK515_24925 [bacterium]|nr:hypothetical protein [Betaproteobacteria bacterium]